MTLVLLAALFAFLPALRADDVGSAKGVGPFLKSQAYDLGDFGHYPVDTYKTTSLRAPRVNRLDIDPACDDGYYLFLNPRGTSVEHGGPMILDNQMNLVWAATGYQQTYNLMAQEYKGKRYLTFWSGNDAVAGHGAGEYYMLDDSYNPVKKIQAAGDLKGDLHEFLFTEEGTALITVYQPQPADLTDLGIEPGKGWIWDCLFQEIDLETYKVKFTWRASEHYSIKDTYRGFSNRSPHENHGMESQPYDFYHINSVEKDPLGNYLVSARFTHSITYIHGKTGEVIWQLGGKRNNFTDLSDGKATNFAWQHDARWHNNYTAITVFDNGAENWNYTNEYSRGMHIKLDQEKMTAELIQDYVHPLHITTSSQGSTQIVPGTGHVLVGFGFDAAFTEFAPDGRVLCTTHFGPHSRFERGDVQSYRVLKFDWVGKPYYKPALVIEENMAYVSWNGATEVSRWVLQGSKIGGEDDSMWHSVKAADKKGFETAMPFGSDIGTFARVVALDKDNMILGISEQVQANFDEAFGNNVHLTIAEADALPVVGLMCVVASGTVIMTGIWLHSWWRSRREERYRKAYQHLEDGADEPLVER